MKDVKDRIMELREKGMIAKDIAATLSKEGYTRPRSGDEYKTTDVYSLITERKTLERQTGTLPIVRRKRKEPTMVELAPVKTPKKVFMFYGDAEDIQHMMERIVSNG